MVQIIDYYWRGKLGYDIRLNHPEATVEDYRQALNRWLDTARWYRSRHPEINDCAGCDRCCQERIPLTVVDLDKLRLNLSSPPKSVLKAVERWGHTAVQGPVADITLKRQANGACLFLDPLTFRCKIYAFRPLVCETFICCPSTLRAQQLREAVVNRGEDELIRQWLLALSAKGVNIEQNPPVDAGRKLQLSLKDWPATPFSGGRNFSEVRLKDLCEPDLWRILTG
jgi:Fe-S-cluster containining protein